MNNTIFIKKLKTSIKNKILETRQLALAIPPNPKIPAITAKIKDTIARISNIIFIL